ncbi:MAG TPA: helix-turn-helix domain-containing protein [Micromonosporaceae bacterium]
MPAEPVDERTRAVEETAGQADASGGAAVPPRELEQSIRAIERAAAAIATTSVARMDEVLPWFRGLPADQRSWVTLVAQAGVRSFVMWLRDPAAAQTRRDTDPGQRRTQELADEIFDAAPRTLARAISLQHTVELIEVTIDVVEERVATLAAPGQEPAVIDAILRFSREVAFSAARVYARAAESRSTWDARLQAQLVDAVLRGGAPDELASRAAVLGWGDRAPVAVAVGPSPGGDAPAVLFNVYRLARRMGLDVIGGVQGSLLVLVLGGASDPLAATGRLVASFGEGPVAVGPGVPTLGEATESARAALAAFRAAPAWSSAPRPVAAADLLPERALAGDAGARRMLRQDIYGGLLRAGGELIDTLDAYYAAGGVLESAARALFVHPNTVRYRLRRVGEITGLSPLDARAAFTLRIALTLGRLDPPTSTGRS